MCTKSRRFRPWSFAFIIAVSITPARADLVAYYTFDGDNAADTSGNSNNGALGSTTSFSSDVPAAIGSGRSAVGDSTGSVNGVITVANTASLQAIANQLTISMWVKADTGVNNSWVRLGQKAGAEGWIIARNNANASTTLRIDSAPSGAGFNQNRGGGGTVFDNTWHHLAYVLDNGAFEEWIDGTKTTDTTYVHGSGFSNTQPLYLVGRSNHSLNGQMDDVSVWSSRLTGAQIGQLAGGASALSLIPNDNPFRILSIDRNPDKTVTLTWVSDAIQGTNFAVRYSPNLTDPISGWADDNDFVPTQGETTIYTTETAFDEPRMFFVVEENPLEVRE